MYTGMDWWTKVRLVVSRGEKSKREVLREEGIHWETLKKILKYSEPPGYRLKEPRPKPKIGPYLERIAQIIEQDKSLPKKQRHTAKRIYERIREMGYGGKYTQYSLILRENLQRIQKRGNHAQWGLALDTIRPKPCDVNLSTVSRVGQDLAVVRNLIVRSSESKLSPMSRIKDDKRHFFLTRTKIGTKVS